MPQLTTNAGSFMASSYATSSSDSAAIRVSGTYLPPNRPYLPVLSGRRNTFSGACTAWTACISLDARCCVGRVAGAMAGLPRKADVRLEVAAAGCAWQELDATLNMAAL